jgi:cytochrome b6-f complex iron-sulfur subunit
MSTSTVLAIAIPVLVLLAGVVLYASARRREAQGAVGQLSRETVKRDRSAAPGLAETAPVTGREVERSAALERRGASTALATAEPAAPPAPYVPPDPETLGVTRRQFFNRSIVGFFVLGLSGFGTAAIAFLWPSLKGGFGSKIRVGKITDIQAAIKDGQGFAYYPEGRMWVVPYPSSALPKAKAVYPPPVLAGMEKGLVALYQKCVHLGCRVPACLTSQWFECPCHGSQYNHVGEKKGGPAPRGLDRFAMSFEGDTFVVDTGTIVLGPAIGTNTTGQEAEGPHCIGGGHE